MRPSTRLNELVLNKTYKRRATPIEPDFRSVDFFPDLAGRALGQLSIAQHYFSKLDVISHQLSKVRDDQNDSPNVIIR